MKTAGAEIFEAPAVVEGFVDYTEQIPGTSVSFDMVAVPGGRFQMGSPESERYRRRDEGPVHEVTVSSFWMGRIEVTWEEFEAWYRATRAEGRTDTRSGSRTAEVDAVDRHRRHSTLRATGPGMGEGRPPGHHHDPPRRGPVHSLAFGGDGKTVPSPHRGRVGVRRPGWNHDPLLL